jgi:hypothetical protein
MRRFLLTILAVALTVLPALAVEVQLRDGTVIEAVKYTLTGSFLMLELADGRQVAYDLADVDLEALKAQQAETEEKPAVKRGEPSLSDGRRQLAMPPKEGVATTGMAITDRDVEHISPDGEGVAPGEGETEEGGEVPDGYQTGGKVVINSLKVTAQGENRWLVEGEIVNRRPTAVIDVRVDLRTEAASGSSPWTGSVSVTNRIEPNQKAAFEHTFKADKPRDKPHPDVRASVIWTEHGEPVPTPPPASQSAPRVPEASDEITYQ